MDILTIVLIIVALGLVGAYAYIRVKERREDGYGAGPERPSAPSRTAVVDDDDEVEEVEEIDVLEDRPASSSWLEDIAVRDDDALADLEALGTTDPAAVEAEELAEVGAADTSYDAGYDTSYEIDELDTTTVDEEFESLTADLEVEDDTPIIVKEDVESADDIMANSKATEINPAGNTELQNLLQKVQARLAQYE